MPRDKTSQLTRRDFLKGAAATGAVLAAGSPLGLLSGCKGGSGAGGKRVIIIGIDGMDPGLAQQMMSAGRLPNLAKMANAGGFRRLGTSIPPQSPVAWSNFINGAGPGTHGIFDFIHRDPTRQAAPVFSISETLRAGKGLAIGDNELHLDFWPFNHKAAKTVLKRQGTPFWDHLDKARIDSTFYNLPANYPASESKYGYHRCLSGLGTPDLLGQYGMYQLFHDDPYDRITRESGGERSFFYFENGTCHEPLKLRGPENSTLIDEKERAESGHVMFSVHRDADSRTAGIDICGRRVLLKEGQWSDWVQVTYTHSMPAILPDRKVPGICRFYLQSVEPVFRLYVSPINFDPSQPAAQITEPASFITDISDDLGLFHTTGFHEAHNARRNDVLNDAEYADQAGFVLQERLELLDYAMANYDDGVLFFYFSSTDMQAHFFYWDSDEAHPIRTATKARQYMDHIRSLYERLDAVVGDIVKRYGDKATVMVMSDHGFANFKRQFNLNTWLRDTGYLQSPRAEHVDQADWSATKAFGMGINGLYLNRLGRERDGIVTADEADALQDKLVRELTAIRDSDGRQVIGNVYRTDQVYAGPASAMAPDLVVGYSRGYRASWETTLGEMPGDIVTDNPSPWSADHCADVSEVPGVLFSNRPIAADAPTLKDIAPTVLTAFGLPTPPEMTGKDVLKS